MTYYSTCNMTGAYTYTYRPFAQNHTHLNVRALQIFEPEDAIVLADVVTSLGYMLSWICCTQKANKGKHLWPFHVLWSHVWCITYL